MRQAGTRKDNKRQEQALDGKPRRRMLTSLLVSLAVILVIAVLVLLAINYVVNPHKAQEGSTELQAQFNFSPPPEVKPESPDLAASTAALQTAEPPEQDARAEIPRAAEPATHPTNEANPDAKSPEENINASGQKLSPQEQEAQAELIQTYINQDFDPKELVSQAYCLIDMESGLVLAGRQAAKAFDPASLTKVMTAILALEHYPDLNQEVNMQEADLAGLEEIGASVAGFQAGQIVTAEDLLYGLLLPSGADAAHALAREVAGSQAAFVQAMNSKAKQLGLKHTHFTNPTGLPEDDLYSTAQDMAMLFWSACQDERFVSIAGSNSYALAPDAYYPEGLSLQSTFLWKFNSDPDFNSKVLAGKSGYSGLEQCQASLFEKNGRLYVLATLGASTDDPSSATAVHDQVVLMNGLVK